MTKSRKISIYPYSGLMSRCFVLEDAYTLAEEYGIDSLEIIWPLQKVCNIRYYDAFDRAQFRKKRLRVTEHDLLESDPGPGIKRSLASGNFRGVMKSLRGWMWLLKKQLNHFLIDRRLQSYKKKGLYISYEPPKEVGWSGEAYHNWLYERWEISKKLLEEGKSICIAAYDGIRKERTSGEKSVADIQFRRDLLEKAKSTVPSGKWVGIHIRRTDHQVAMSVSRPELFKEKMDEILSEDPGIRFFLATDDAATEEDFLQSYDSRIHTYKKEWGRDSRKGMEDAIIEMLCLSRCDYIIGSYTSNFSQFAALYGGIELSVCGIDE